MGGDSLLRLGERSRNAVIGYLEEHPLYYRSISDLLMDRVKSFKFRFRRVVGFLTLSKTKFATLLCQIEARLNSRSIATLSDDPSDLYALISGHFLIGRPFVFVPEESMLDIDANRLSPWQLVQAMQEQIWRSWSKDLHSLQNRNKWSEPQLEDVLVNDLVLSEIRCSPLLSESWLRSCKCILIRMDTSA